MKPILWGGIALFIGSILLIMSNYGNLNVERNGIIVKMRIEQLPESCLGTKIKHFAKLNYEGKTYIKRIGGKFCDDHNVGEQIEVKFLKGYSIILFPDETVVLNLVAFSALGITGLGMVLWQRGKKGK
ncbi:MAG: hypothetical protein QM731_01575 [Chitinophagaceae bacterium]